MRRGRDRDTSPKSIRSHVRRGHRDRSGPGSPRRPSHRDRSGEEKSYSSHHHTTLRMSGMKSSRSDSFRTLCVRNFSSKLSVEAIQNYLFQDFNEFGDMSISVGHLDGVRAALINFKYAEDAQAAFAAKPTVFLHDRSVAIEPLLDTFTEKGGLSKTFGTGKPPSDVEDEEDELEPVFERRHPRHGVSHKLDPRFTAEIPSKSIGGPSAVAPPSLLGMPSLASSAMMAAAAARALGFGSANPLATGIPPPIQAPPLKCHSLLKATGSRWYEAQHRAHSPPASDDAEQNLKATRTLFIGSLEPDITESEVLDAFERYGYVEQVDIKRSPKVGMHSYAFVRFQNVDMAYRAKSAMSGRCIRSLHCKIGYGKCIPSTCLYIGGLGKNMAMDLMHRLLPRLVQVVQIDFAPGRNFAQILFETCEAACEASKQLKNMAVGLRLDKRLRVDFIDPETFRGPRSKHTIGTFPPLDSHLSGGVYPPTGLDLRDSIHGFPGEMHAKLSAGFSGSLANMARFGQFTKNPALHQLVGSDSITYHGRQNLSDSITNESQMKSISAHHFTTSERRSAAGHHRGRTRTLLSPAMHPMHLTLQSVQSLTELDRCLQPDLWQGEFVLKKCGFPFRCLHVIGDAELGSRLVPNSRRRSSSDPPSEDEPATKPVLHILQRGTLDPAWMAEATHRIHAVLSSHSRGLCLLLVLPTCDSDDLAPPPASQDSGKDESGMGSAKAHRDKSYPLAALIAYLKLKQAVGLVVPAAAAGVTSGEGTVNSDECTDKKSDNATATLFDSHRIFLFAPSSFALILLKQAAPNLGSELATMDKYMVLLVVKR